MKTNIFFFAALFFAAIVVSSCQKDDETSTVIIDEIADDIASTLGGNGSGLADEFTETTQIADRFNASLKAAVADTLYATDTTFARTNTPGASHKYSYNFTRKYGYVYQIGESYFYYHGSLDGSYDTRRLAGADNRTTDVKITGFAITSTTYALNGTSQRSGNCQSKVRNKSTVTSSSQITATDVKMNKSTYAIESGSLSWEISGKVNDIDFNYTAQVVFNGNGSATLTINGKEYTIDLSSGEVQ
jgi:hypothetical protein